MLEEDKTRHSMYLAVRGPLHHMSYHYSNYYSINNPLMIWTNQIFQDYAGHTTLALTIIKFN